MTFLLRAFGLTAALFGVLAGVPAPALRAQAPATVPASSFRLDAPIPFDSAIRSGTLPNGLQYFIRQNGRPAQRVALRLAVKAGSRHEADDQRGLAHFIEHMGFNGSAHFEPGALVSYFESVGARLGPHVNAYTSFDETVYMFELPTTSADVLKTGFTALADFAGGLTLGPQEVERERGVVIEEWRGRLGAGTRIRDQQTPILFAGSRYAERMPIGDPDVIRSAPVARIRDFYDTWYRPERMAIMAVGDIDAAQVESMIREAFGPLTPRAPARPGPDATVPLDGSLRIGIAADPEITQTSAQLIWKRPSEGQSLVGDYRRSLIQRLFENMLNERLGDLTRRPDAKILTGGGSDGSLTPTVSTFSLGGRVPEGGLIEGVTTLEIEARRVREFGFNAAELDRAKRWMTAFYERAYNERGTTESDSYADEYVRHFLEGEPSPGIAYEFALVKEVLPAVTLEEVTALARSRLTADTRAVLAVLPRKEGLPPPQEGDLAAAVASVAALAVMPLAESASARATLMDKAPAAGRLASRRELPDVGVTILRFANGVEAWLKPTDFKTDQILFTMYAPGGTALAPPADFVEASLADTYVGLSGFGGLTPPERDKVLAGKLASASPFISLMTHGISGSAAPAELETSLQLLYQAFTAPGDDPEMFALMRRRLEASVANQGRNPGQVYGERLALINTSNHYSMQPLTGERVAALDPGKIVSFYRDRFANAADFTFFMAGAFTVDGVVPLLERYLASLPSTGQRQAAHKDPGVLFPKGIVRERVEKGREPTSETVISFYADPSPDPVEQELVGAAITVLETVLRDLLREELGQTYTVGVGLAQSLPQRGGGHIQVSFGAAPENIDRMTERVLEAVQELQREGPSADLVGRAKESALRSYETSMKQNGYWMRRLQSIHLLGRNPSEILTRPERIASITRDNVQEALKTYFPMDRYTIVTLMPEPAPGQ
jgi:zinc protease